MAAEKIIEVASALEATEDSMDVDARSWLDADERAELMRKRGRLDAEEEEEILERDPSYVLGVEDIQMYVADAVAGHQLTELVLAGVSSEWRRAIRRSIKKRRAHHGFPALCAEAAARGDLGILGWLRNHGAAWDRAACEAAARGGHLLVLKCLTVWGCPWSIYAATEAARAGRLEVLEWILRTNRPCYLDHIGYEAASHGHLEILRWLHGSGRTFGPYLLGNAVRSGNLDVVKWAMERRGLRFSAGYGLEEAVAGGNLEVVRYVHAQGIPWDVRCAAVAGRLGNLEILRWADGEGLLTQGSTDPDVVETAVRKGNLDLVKFLLSKGFAVETEMLCAHAAQSGSLEMLKWARDNNGTWAEPVCTEAARGGHLEMLQWCWEQGCPWDENTCGAAAGGGHLEVLQWAHANGCPWNVSACTSAAYGGHLIVLQWLRANGCPWDETTTEAAASSNKLEVLQWLRSQGCPWNSEVLRFGVGEALIWARENGAPPVPNDPDSDDSDDEQA